MSYLVYCHTCNGKMSVTAKKCPHCGEWLFYDKIEHRTSKTIKDICPKCKGTKIDTKPSWRDSFYYEIHQLQGYKTGVVSPYDLEKACWFYWATPNKMQKDFFAQCISKGDYILEKEQSNARYTGTLRTVSVGKFYRNCYNCDGLGYTTREEVTVTEERIDRRKRVPDKIQQIAPPKKALEKVLERNVSINDLGEKIGQWDGNSKEIDYIFSEGFDLYNDLIYEGYTDIYSFFPDFFEDLFILIKRVHKNNKLIEIALSFQYGICAVQYKKQNSQYTHEFSAVLTPDKYSLKKAYEEVKHYLQRDNF